MNEIIASIHPRFVKNIFDGIKTLELRKSAPEFPFKAYVYETKKDGGCGLIVGEFLCQKVDTFNNREEESQECETSKMIRSKWCAEGCVSGKEFDAYYGVAPVGYAWCIYTPTRYDKPKRISDYGIGFPPQSWQYISKDNSKLNKE